MGNAWVSPYISHSTGKCNKTHGMGKVCEIDTNAFPIVWVLISHRVPSYGIPCHTRNVWVSLHISHSTGKCNKSHGIAKVWGIDTHTFFIVWVRLFH